MKTCSKCGKTKELAEFNKDKSKIDGLRHNCRGCQKMYNDKWQKDNTEHHRVYKEGWLSERPSYLCWCAMKQRCLNPKATRYECYGGRGITIHPDFMTWEGFYAYMGDRPDGMSIDRIDNDGNYEPGNVRWATPKEQANNTRRTYVQWRADKNTWRMYTM